VPVFRCLFSQLLNLQLVAYSYMSEGSWLYAEECKCCQNIIMDDVLL